MSQIKVSIIILAHGALYYCWKTLSTLAKTKDVSYEVIVVDNNSGLFTKLFLESQLKRGRIHKLLSLNSNLYFSKGNNIGSQIAAGDSSHILLLNSDVEIRDSYWLKKLLDMHQRGVTAYGFVEAPWPRADGYCFLIDKDLYLKHKLREEFLWWWSITRIQAELLKEGHLVQAVEKHDHILYHFGGKSGKVSASINPDIKMNEVVQWFDGRHIKRIKTI